MMDADELNAQRQHELARFLRQARTRANPAAAGIQTGGRRRTAGLRREEVAALAGVSAIWYTWLEQGRDIQPSQKLLGALATALQLNSSEREYLHALGRTIAPRIVEPERPRPELQRLLAELTVPGFMVDHRWNLVGYNCAAEVLFPLDDSGDDQRNLMTLLFQAAEARPYLPDWQSVAQAAVAFFHVNYARNVDDIGMGRLVRRLQAESPEFAQMWNEQCIESDPHCVSAIKHWTEEILRFEFVILRTSGPAEITVFTLIPADAQSAEAWERLSGSPPVHEMRKPDEVLCAGRS